MWGKNFRFKQLKNLVKKRYTSYLSYKRLRSTLKEYFLHLSKLKLWRSPILLVLLFFLSTTIPLVTAQVSVSTPTAQNSQNTFKLLQQGQKLYQTQQFESSAKIWQELADDFALQGDSLNQAMALSNLSLTQQHLGEWEGARTAIEQSLNLLGALSPDSQQKRILASSLDIQGQRQLAIGQPENALPTWQKATDIYRDIDDRNGVTRSQINQAQAMQNLGVYPRACQTLLEALELDNTDCGVISAQLQELTAGDSPPLQVLGLRSLGNILRVIGKTEQSQQVLLKSWQLASQLESNSELGAIYLGLGNTIHALANQELSKQQRQSLEKSIEPRACTQELEADQTPEQFYQQATDCYNQAQLQGTSEIKVQAQLNLLSLSLQRQNWSSAEELLLQLPTQIDRLTPNSTAISARLKLAENMMCMQSAINGVTSGVSSPVFQSCSLPKIKTNEWSSSSIPSWQEIQKQVTIAIKQAQTLGDKQSQANALGYLGATYQQQGQLAKAEQLTQQALQGLSAFNNPELVYFWQWQLGRLYQLGDQTPKAIASYDSAWKILQSLRQDLVATNPDIQFNFRDRVEPVYRELVDLLLQPSGEQGEISQENLLQARDIIESLQIAELNNFFQEACIEAKAEPIDRLDPTAGVIYSIILPKRLAIILSISGKPLTYYETAINEGGEISALEEIEKTFDDMFANLNPYISSANPLGANQQFYDWLIRPLETELQNSDINTLVFVLDDVMRSLPMAALHDGEQYLVEKYNIALTPTLQLLSSRSLSSDNLRVLAGGLAEARQGFSALPAVTDEVNEIARIASAEVLLDKDFTTSRLQTKIEKTSFPIVHLATHGQFSSQADNTFLLTWDERINVKDLDQLLQARESGDLTPIELLILSACQTATGDKRAVLGLAGVAVRSGARSTLATLWSVQDQSTSEVMSEFYENLSQSGVTKAEALRQAQLSLLRSSEYQHPFYWAPFVLVGNWQ